MFEQIFKNIDNVLRNESGCTTELDYVEQTSWILFLKYLDRSDVIDLAEAIHGEDCHIIGMTAWVTGPGRPDQQYHCDWLPIEFDPGQT